MQMVLGFEALSRDWPESTVCIGVFDGMHLGHQAVVNRAVEEARAAGRPAVAITFDRHPMAIISPNNCPQSLSTLESKLAIMAELGIDVTIIVAFDSAFSRLSADDFLNFFLINKLRAKEVVVGHDFGFGHMRAGTPEWLSERIQTHVLLPIELQCERISSSRIRGLISKGFVSEAAALLGRNYTLSGIVVRGQRLGTELGVPTANLVPVTDQVRPAAGIYAGRCSVGGTAFEAAISVGNRPTVPGAGFAIEAHLMDYSGSDLYGQSISLEFVERLRDELSFDSLNALKTQMGLDIECARNALVHHG